MTLNTIPLWHVTYAAIVVMLLAWFWQLKSKNSGIVDALWALGVMAGSVYLATLGNGDFQLRILLALIGGLWFLRLGIHLLIRILSEPEDGRYQAIRKKMGSKINLFHFIFYLLQAGFVVISVLPIWMLSHHTAPLTWTMIVAIIIIVIAFIGEYQADHQLHLFRQDPNNKGKTCRLGLWKYSRHPNYFFEWCHWFAYPILGIGMTNAAWLWLAPVIMFIFLFYLTGIPYTEMQALKSRSDYHDYQKKTSAFFPMPAKK